MRTISTKKIFNVRKLADLSIEAIRAETTAGIALKRYTSYYSHTIIERSICSRYVKYLKTDRTVSYRDASGMSG